MNDQKRKPGISRTDTSSTEGLERLEKQLTSGINICPRVLEQWIKRYGDAARAIIKKHKRQRSELD